MNKKIVLLVEDNADDEFFTCRGLNGSGVALTLHVARDGADALEMLLGQSGSVLHPDLIVLDINMPKLDGIDVLVRLRKDERTRWTPVVILTSSTQASDIARAYQAGANSYLSKPMDTQRMQELLGDMARYWLRDNHLPANPLQTRP